MNTRLRTLRQHPVRLALGLILLAVAALIALWDWNWFKGLVERQVEARTGRRFEIRGDLDVNLGRVSTISAEQLSLGNAEWSREPLMAAADRVELDLALWPLLKGTVRIPELRLQTPRLHLETGPKGVGNWQFDGPDEEGGGPEFRRLTIEDGRLRFLDAARRTDIRVDLATVRGSAAGRAPLVARGGGRWEGNRFTVEGRAESPLALQDTESPYRIDVRTSAGSTHAHARGTLLDPLRLRDFDLRLALRGRNLEHLYPLLGLSLPPTPPYAFDGRLTRDIQPGRDGRRLTLWRYDGFTGRVGDSDLRGTASVQTGGTRPLLKADLTSRLLDFDDLAGFVGSAPDRGRGESTNAELAALAAREDARPRLLPDTPYNLEKLNSMDADVRLRAGRIEAPGWPLDDMDAHLKLDGGVLVLDPLAFGVAGGELRSTVKMDAREAPIRTQAEIAVRRLDLPRLLPDTRLAEQAIGRIGGDISLTGRGNSIAAMLGTADGDVAMGMGRGQISNLLLELAGLDVAEALKFLLTDDRRVPVRCAFADFAVKDGVMEARALAFDTTDTILVGQGRVSLKDETLDMELRPRPKDRSLLSLRSPLVVGGTFKAPTIRPDLKRVGLRGAIALALGSIAPPAALLATLELGPGEDAQCGGRYAR